MADEIVVKNKRLNWLASLLGPLATQRREELREAEALMDGAGIARKAEGEEEPPANPPPPPPVEETVPDDPGDMMAKVSAKVAADLMVSLRDKLGNVTEEELSAAIYTALEAPADDPEGEGEVTPPEEEQIMDSKEAKKPLAPEEQKAYAESFASMVKDMSDTAKYVQAMAEGQKATAESQKSILEAVAALVKQVTALEQKVNDRPRSASQAAETLIDPTSDAAKALQDAIKKTQAGSDKRVLGVRVSE